MKKDKQLMCFSPVYLLLMYVLFYAQQANAANWFKLRGTEPGDIPHAVKFFGFIQPTYIKEYNDRISGAWRACRQDGGRNDRTGCERGETGSRHNST